MGGCCSSQNNAAGAVPPRAPRPQAGGAGGPVLLEQSSAANSTKAEQLKAADAQGVGARGLVSSEEDFAQRVTATDDEGSCVQIKVLTYNLHWWNLYDKRGGDEGSASKLIAASQPDLVACQECKDITRVLHEGSMQESHAAIRGPHALGVAYKKDTFEVLSQGYAEVAKDEAQQFYSCRSVSWARLKHKDTGKVVFFMNHHGPLRVNSGGREGGPTVAQRILRAICDNSEPGDAVVLAGDFNAQVGSQTVRDVERCLPRAYSGHALGGIDHFFSRQPVVASENLGPAGSDHDALAATFLV